MEIFISWSGELSKELGEIFSNWIASVLQFVRPYFTPDDMEKGSRWSSEIAKELQESQIGIIVLTRDNLSKPWIMFEAGALSKQMEKAKICPILFGLEKTDLVGPLVQFQATSFTKEDMKKLVKTINNECGDNKLRDSVVDSVFEVWWPKLEEQVNLVMGKERDKGHEKLRSERELIEEILSLTRMSVSRTLREPGEYLSPKAIENLYITFHKLKHAVALSNIALIEDCCREIGEPIEYIAARTRIAPWIRERIASERPPKVEHIEDEKEQEGGAG
jgi:hypothetical protein